MSSFHLLLLPSLAGGPDLDSTVGCSAGIGADSALEGAGLALEASGAGFIAASLADWSMVVQVVSEFLERRRVLYGAIVKNKPNSSTSSQSSDKKQCQSARCLENERMTCQHADGNSPNSE